MTKERTIEISLHGTETVEHYASAIIAVPVDATKEEIETLCADEVEYLLCERSSPPSWEIEESDGIYADRLCVEGNSEGEMAELIFIRDEDGSLVALPEHIEEQLVS